MSQGYFHISVDDEESRREGMVSLDLLSEEEDLDEGLNGGKKLVNWKLG